MAINRAQACFENGQPLATLHPGNALECEGLIPLIDEVEHPALAHLGRGGAQHGRHRFIGTHRQSVLVELPNALAGGIEDAFELGPVAAQFLFKRDAVGDIAQHDAQPGQIPAGAGDVGSAALTVAFRTVAPVEPERQGAFVEPRFRSRTGAERGKVVRDPRESAGRGLGTDNVCRGKTVGDVALVEPQEITRVGIQERDTPIERGLNKCLGEVFSQLVAVMQQRRQSLGGLLLPVALIGHDQCDPGPSYRQCRVSRAK